ncbi:hypothetical protein H2203_007922 [Taxawa tesnikishii (nom. ined.)]|nr:hypothetical protein H2203_007922 [Dothideales sp. JES 119]
MALVKLMYNINAKAVQGAEQWIGLGSKIFAFVGPAVVTGLRTLPEARRNLAAALVLANVFLVSSLAIGTVCMALILIKYLRSRKEFGSTSGYGTGTGTGAMPSGGVATSRSGIRAMISGRMRIDRWLILRFSIAFLVLSAFEVFLIYFEFSRFHKSKRTDPASTPDFSHSSTISDYANYVPGVTASLFAFCLFGTTAPFRRRYAEAIKGAFSCIRIRPSPRAPSQDWSHMESQEATTQKYRLNHGRLESIELQNPGHLSKNTMPSVVIEEDGVSVRSESRLDQARSPQPWRSLGPDRPA